MSQWGCVSLPFLQLFSRLWNVALGERPRVSSAAGEKCEQRNMTYVGSDKNKEEKQAEWVRESWGGFSVGRGAWLVRRP